MGVHKHSPRLTPLVFRGPLSSTTLLFACVARISFVASARAPCWVNSQQSAQLCALFHALRQAALRRYSHLSPVTDKSSAFFTALHGHCSSSHGAHVCKLRRMNCLYSTFSSQFQLALIPSERNPAGPFSRFVCQQPLSLAWRACSCAATHSFFPVAHTPSRVFGGSLRLSLGFVAVMLVALFGKLKFPKETRLTRANLFFWG